MSQQELDRGDQEVMGLVNGAASEEVNRMAEDLANDFREPSPEEIAAAEAEERCREEKKAWQAYIRKKKCAACLGVMACVVIAVLLVAVLFMPELLTWVVNLGVLICGMVAAVIVERRRRWH